MHSEGSSFCGDVVLDSVNMAYRNEVSISDQIYEDKNIFLNFYQGDFEFKSDWRKCIFVFDVFGQKYCLPSWMSKTTSPQNMFQSHCITLYMI